MSHGLSERQLLTLKRILSLYADEITRVDLFGSRSTGSHRPNSDIDLALHGSLPEKSVDRLATLFAESSLPFSVDVKSYELTAYAPLKAHMDRVRVPLFSQRELKASARSSRESG